jgi:hypothetical protein
MPIHTLRRRKPDAPHGRVSQVRAHSVLIEARDFYPLDHAPNDALSVTRKHLLPKQDLGVFEVMAGKTASER